jgi:tetraacyldisaccharide 4'-kinase
LGLSQHTRNLLWGLLYPLSFLWAFGAAFRRWYYPRDKRYRSRLPVICVGNLHSGGSGKTPLVLELAARYRERQPVILSRGYKGTMSESGARVDLARTNGPTLYGDEPWMLAERTGCPVYVGRDRLRWVKFLEEEGEKRLIILDDGFQYLPLRSSCDLVLVNTRRQPADSYCIPWGEMREPFSAIRRAAAVLLTGTSESLSRGWKTFLQKSFPNVPVFEIYRRAEGIWEGDAPYTPAPGESLAAFCGIADPESFRSDLKRAPHARLIDVFPDHHLYQEKDIVSLIELRKKLGASAFLTTEKDWYKVAPLFIARGERVLRLRIRYEVPEDFWYFLDKRMEMQWP